MADETAPGDLVRDGALDAELAALLSVLLEARTPVVVAGQSQAGREWLAGGLRGFLPGTARLAEVSPDDDFGWLPEAATLGWRHDGPVGAVAGEALDPSNGVLVVRGLAAAGGVTGERARVVVRALALGYGLLGTMEGGGLDDVLAALHDPAVGTDPDERSRLGVVLAIGADGRRTRVTAAHYVRPVATDTHGHVQRLPPAVLATWNPAAARWDHFAWGVLPELAGRLGLRTVELEREQARRAAGFSRFAGGG